MPSGRSFGNVCGGPITQDLWPSLGHTVALIGMTLVLVALLSVLLGVLAATRQGTVFDVALRGFSYTAWAVPPFLLALVLQSTLSWAGSTYGFRPFPLSGWPGNCGFVAVCATPHGLHYWWQVLLHLALPAIAMSVAFIGIHSRYLRSALLVSLAAPYTTTARAKGLPERRVVLRHALRNSLSVFSSALLLDIGTVLGASLAVDWVFRLNGLGMLFITQVAGVGGGDGPRYLDPYAIMALLALTAVFVVGSALLSELAVVWLDPRVRLL